MSDQPAGPYALSAKRVSHSEAQQLIDRVLGQEDVSRKRLSDGNLAELPTYSVLYIILNDGRDEALIAVKTDAKRPAVCEITGFARIVGKDRRTAEGWRYLRCLLETILFPEGVTTIKAQALSRGGIGAFQDLRLKWGRPDCDVRMVPADLPINQGFFVKISRY